MRCWSAACSRGPVKPRSAFETRSGCYCWQGPRAGPLHCRMGRGQRFGWPGYPPPRWAEEFRDTLLYRAAGWGDHKPIRHSPSVGSMGNPLRSSGSTTPTPRPSARCGPLLAITRSFPKRANITRALSPMSDPLTIIPNRDAAAGRQKPRLGGVATAVAAARLKRANAAPSTSRCPAAIFRSNGARSDDHVLDDGELRPSNMKVVSIPALFASPLRR